MPEIDYHTSINIHLSLEDYYNSGLSPEDAKKVIESIRDPGLSTTNLYCRPAGINNNWIVQTNAPQVCIRTLVRVIDHALTLFMLRQ